MYGIIWSPTLFPISQKKTSSSSSYFTSPSFVFTFILFIQVYFDSLDYVFQWIRLTFDDDFQFIFFSSGFRFDIEFAYLYINIRTSFCLRKLNCKSHMSILFVYMTCVNMSRAWNTPTHFINNFLIRVVENGFCLFCNSHKRNKKKMKIEKAQKE